MCDSGHAHHGDQFGFLVDTPEIRALIEETQRQMAETAEPADRVEALKITRNIAKLPNLLRR